MSEKIVIIDATGTTPTVNGVPMSVEEVAKTVGVDLTLGLTPSPDAPQVSTGAIATTVKRGIAYRMPDGSVKPRGKGRPPLGSVLIAADGTECGLPVTSKAAKPVKATTWVLKPNGQIVARGKGKPNSRDIVVAGPMAEIPDNFKPACTVPGEGTIESLANAVKGAMVYIPQKLDAAVRAVGEAKTFGEALLIANKFVEIQ